MYRNSVCIDDCKMIENNRKVVLYIISDECENGT